MMRFISGFFITAIFLSSQAFAGFEWVPPMNNPAPLPQETMSVEHGNVSDLSPSVGSAFPAPAVSMEPLDNQMPVNILPQQQSKRSAVQPVKTKNLSGKKIIIDPYPLRDTDPLPVENHASMSEVYKAMNEEVGKLHPVKLGSGMTTGAKKKKAFIPKATRLSSSSHKTFLTPTETGITPMVGVEPPPLPGMGVPRAPTDEASQKIYAEAVGFGRDLPLALALSQVIPSEFTHSFAKDVDAGATVSWEGGKPWDQVLNDMLRPKDLMAVIQDDQVTIQPTAKL